MIFAVSFKHLHKLKFTNLSNIFKSSWSSRTELLNYRNQLFLSELLILVITEPGCHNISFVQMMKRNANLFKLKTPNNSQGCRTEFFNLQILHFVNNIINIHLSCKLCLAIVARIYLHTSYKMKPISKLLLHLYPDI